MSDRSRAAVAALLVALLAGVVAASQPTAPLAPDFDHLWRATALALQGRDPYALTGPGRPNDWPWPLYYPAPVFVVLAPFTLLPLEWARGAFVGLGAGLFTYAGARDEWRRWPVLLSYSAWDAVVRAQWSPLVSAGLVLPVAIGVVGAVKPTIGAAMFAARPARRALVAGVVLVAASLVLWPAWPMRYAAVLGAGELHHRAPITYFGGPIVLLALLRWRRPEARLIVALACAPQTFASYELLPLALVPRTPVQGAIFAVATHASVRLGRIDFWTAAEAGLPAGNPERLALALAAQAPWFIALVYLPCVMMVLGRPNEGETPAWIERGIVNARARLSRLSRRGTVA